eukprot:755388-Hanusia_phi.AAC.1
MIGTAAPARPGVNPVTRPGGGPRRRPAGPGAAVGGFEALGRGFQVPRPKRLRTAKNPTDSEL